MSIVWVPSPNFNGGRNGRRPIAIINHKTAGRYPGCKTWLCNPVAKVSAHYLITRKGEIIQLVRDEDTAWHAGTVNKPDWPLYDRTNPNRYTLGIEHEDYRGDGELGLTELQFQASLWLHNMLINRWGIPVDTDHIAGHYRIDSVNKSNCPGPYFPWDRLLTMLRRLSINVVIDDNYMLGFIKGDRAYVPVRAIAEVLKFPYSWDDVTKSVIINGVSIKVEIIGEAGYAKAIEIAPAIGRTASWDGVSRSVLIL